jgi:hypothetical protein
VVCALVNQGGPLRSRVRHPVSSTWKRWSDWSSPTTSSTGTASSFDRYCIIGTQAEFLAKLDEIEAAGATATGISGPADRAVEVLRAYRSRRPASGLAPSPLNPANR